MILLGKDNRGTVWSCPGADRPHSLLVVNPFALTLRGLHWQEEPAERRKRITIISGAAQVAVVDLRKRDLVFFCGLVPGDFVDVTEYQACGYLTTAVHTVLHYSIYGAPRSVQHERGVRFDDPAFDIPWGARPVLISPRDDAWPNFDEQVDL